jgi:hypothetical protein
VDPKQPKTEFDVNDPVALRAKLIETARLLATPIDFAGLIRDGVLAASNGDWYEVHDMGRLPEHAWKQVTELRHEKRGDTHRNFFKFGVKNEQAAVLYEQLTGTRLAPGL